MTYQDALVEILVRYKGGERDIEVSADVFAGYLSGVIVCERTGPPTQEAATPSLAFKDAVVRRAADVPTCDKCGKELEVGAWPFCPHGRGCYGVQDDSIPGGLEIKNGLCNADGTPRKYYSRTEIAAEAKARGMENHVTHIGSKGSDKSKHTTRWV